MMSSDFPELYDIFKVGAASPNVNLADPDKNVENIMDILNSPALIDCSFIVLPELCLTGYTCADLFFQDCLLFKVRNALGNLRKKLAEDNRFIVVGAPLLYQDRLYNCAIPISNGEILGIVPKINIPNYQEFYEKRWFTSGKDIKDSYYEIDGNEVPFGTDLIFRHKDVEIGIEICEDLWVPSPPSSYQCRNGAEIILNLSATDDNVGKFQYIKQLVSSQSGRCRCVYVYASAGHGESSTDLVFSGLDLIASDGIMLSEGERFSLSPSYTTAVVDIEKIRQERRKYSTFHQKFNSFESKVRIIDSNISIKDQSFDFQINPTPFIPNEKNERRESCEEIINIQSSGLIQRLRATNCKNLVVGISGGLDSTLALLIAHYTFVRLGYDVKGILGVTMPSEATSKRTYYNSLDLMKELGVSTREISVREAVERHFCDIGHNKEVHDAVYENSQARERTQILMDLANKVNGMVLGTGDMSEQALGWCTYNGDHMSMYNVNGGVPKTLVRFLVEWFAITTSNYKLKNVLNDIIDTPISPELIPSEDEDKIGQKTEEIVGPYELHDFFLYHTIRNGFKPKKIFYLASKAFQSKYKQSIIKRWLINFYKRFFSQQFKRSCMPDGPKVGSVCLSPRGDWRMPSDASARLWIKEVEEINVKGE